MRLNLRFQGNDIDGGGSDPVGEFKVSGIFSETTGGVLFTKTYATHAVEYSGSWDGAMIYGKWTLHDEQFTEIGEFEIWPEKEEQLASAGAAVAGEELKFPDTF